MTMGRRFFDILVCIIIALALILLIPIGICALLGFMLADWAERTFSRKARRA